MPPIRGRATSPATLPNTQQEHVRRPPNAFMLFRQNMSAQLPPPAPGAPRLSQGELSRQFAKLWRELPHEQRTFWEQQAAFKDAEHKIKYPNYKYQPKKKEEKTRLAEERKAEKKRAAVAKKQSRFRSTSSTTPAAAHNATPLVAPHPTQPAPYFIPTPQHYIPVPFMGSIDPNATSPPMSAASTPGPDSSLNASPAPQPGLLMSPAPLTLHSSSISLPYPIARPPALPMGASDYVAPAHVNTGDWDLGSTAHQDSNWNESSFESTENQSLYFDISPGDVHQVNTWLNEKGASHEDQVHHPQTGSSYFHAYQLENFNLGNAVSDFNGELSVRVGDLPPLEETLSYFPPDFSLPVPISDFYNQYQPESDFSGLYPDNAAFSQLFDLTFLAEDSSLTFMNTPSSEDFNDTFNVALLPVENAVASSSAAQPYVPPSGAANSGNRRVAASYRKESLYSMDRSSPLPA